MLINEISPRARCILAAAESLEIPKDRIINAINENIDSMNLPYSSPDMRIAAIALALITTDDDFDDFIHEISHLIPNALLECECGESECDICCDCIL